MIRMVIADDEPVITRGIQKLVDWKSLGIEVAGVYGDGREAMGGILKEKPDVALLDISMPGMTGVEILRELKELELSVPIIFISGFQDFEYAKAALKYGASDYLLKPVVKEELLGAVEKAVSALRTDRAEQGVGTGGGGEEEKRADYGRLAEMEQTTYLPVYADILYNGSEEEQERRLLRFSMISILENYLETGEKGILFTKNDNIVLVLKGMDKAAARWELNVLSRRMKEENGYDTAFIIGKEIFSMGAIPAAYAECVRCKGYLFFAGQLGKRVFDAQEELFRQTADAGELRDVREKLTETILTGNREKFEKLLEQFTKLACLLSDGKKEDACYHFCSLIRHMEDRFLSMGFAGTGCETAELLEQGRACENYGGMVRLYREYLGRFVQCLDRSAGGQDKKDIVRAKEFIEENYADNLTLEVLAGEIHMNPYYFSSYFKKNTGENFKDYLNRVRMKHALLLLASSDMTNAQIAEAIGYRDIRSFKEVFQRAYGETPTEYRKRREAGK